MFLKNESSVREEDIWAMISSWHPPLWVHSHVQHLRLQPLGSLAALLQDCLNWKSIYLLFSYGFVGASPFPHQTQRSLLLFLKQRKQISNNPKARKGSDGSVSSHKPLPFLCLCGNKTSRPERTNRCHSSGSTRRLPGSPLCFSAQWVYIGWQPFPAVSESLTETHSQ